MKAAALSKSIDDNEFLEETILHSGQHYDEALSGAFFKELGLKAPRYNLGIGSDSPNKQIGNFLLVIDEIIDREKPDMVIVFGDTNTTAAGAIAAAKKKIPLAHVEAGLREWNKQAPEESNKLITDVLSDLLFCPSQTGVDNLLKAGIIEGVFLTGDISLDLLSDQTKYLDPKEFRLQESLEKKFYFFTCHRESNTESRRNMEQLVSFLNQSITQIIWPIHPRTQKALKRFNLNITNPKVNIIEPIGYWLTQNYIRNAQVVITDSGGIIKETYFHSTQGIIIDKQTEWIETIEEGWNMITGPDSDKIQTAIDNLKKPSQNNKTLGRGQAGRIIVDKIVQYLQSKDGKG